MRMTRRTRIQLVFFLIVAVAFMWIMAFTYMRLPATLFGIGHYTVTVQLPETGNLYKDANVTYRGTEIGHVRDIRLTHHGADAVLLLKSGVDVPADLDAEVHSNSAIGEQYVALVPRSAVGPVLTDGDVIPTDRTYVPPDINALLDATNRGLEAIPQENLKTVVDEAFLAVGGLGPELSRSVKGSTALAVDARDNLDSLTALIDYVGPVLDSQSDSGDSIQAWARNLAAITKGLQAQDAAVAGVLTTGPTAADEVRQLIDRLQPTLPVLLANLVSLGEVAVAYRPNLEQLLVLMPQGVAAVNAIQLPGKNVKTDYYGAQFAFNLNMNVPPVCTTGFLPAQQTRNPAFEDYPERAPGELYCRIPQDSWSNVRGTRNYPCTTEPGKRAPTARMCESDEIFVPLNEGHNWKGDPNATLTGQDVPHVQPNSEPDATVPAGGDTSAAGPISPIAVAEYDPATGTYVGPDGLRHTQSNLARPAGEEKTWKNMLITPGMR